MTSHSLKMKDECLITSYLTKQHSVSSGQVQISLNSPGSWTAQSSNFSWLLYARHKLV